MRPNDLPSVVVMSMIFSLWVVVYWPLVDNSCVSRIVPLPLAKANSLAFVLVSLGGRVI
jgi:hypothetical protein